MCFGNWKSLLLAWGLVPKLGLLARQSLFVPPDVFRALSQQFLLRCVRTYIQCGPWRTAKPAPRRCSSSENVCLVLFRLVSQIGKGQTVNVESGWWRIFCLDKKKNSLLEWKTQRLCVLVNLLSSTRKSLISLGATLLFDSCKGKILEWVKTNGVKHYREALSIISWSKTAHTGWQFRLWSGPFPWLAEPRPRSTLQINLTNNYNLGSDFRQFENRLSGALGCILSVCSAC